ncbi:MAG: hypothetical protein QOJ22_1378 [Thermoleophilaceae bacterium]|nr:hypothetical protein [Thermoleophilaceae bacterium]
MLQAALNGDRTADEHPAIPRTPEELAVAAAGAVREGAQVLHLHPYDEDGRQTVEAEPCAAAIRAVREACPGVPVSLSTSEAIEPDPDKRLNLVKQWIELPDLVTANQGEAGIEELCDLLLERGVGIEAGLLTRADARAFVARPALVARCVRAMVEPLDADPSDAVAHGAHIERTLTDAGIPLPQVHHGDAIATWDVMDRGAARGHGIRVGLEDTVVMPDGSLVEDNAMLVAEAARMLAR